jgi:hypothetical protein
MSLASPALLLFCLFTHNLRCGLEECRQLRWLVVSKNHAVRALEQHIKIQFKTPLIGSKESSKLGVANVGMHGQRVEVVG